MGWDGIGGQFNTDCTKPFPLMFEEVLGVSRLSSLIS